MATYPVTKHSVVYLRFEPRSEKTGFPTRSDTNLAVQS